MAYTTGPKHNGECPVHGTLLNWEKKPAVKSWIRNELKRNQNGSHIFPEVLYNIYNVLVTLVIKIKIKEDILMI